MTLTAQSRLCRPRRSMAGRATGFGFRAVASKESRRETAVDAAPEGHVGDASRDRPRAKTAEEPLVPKTGVGRVGGQIARDGLRHVAINARVLPQMVVQVSPECRP